ncbi:MAG: hypothetical protein FJ109_04775 [Deltaproteobacteria bacterium]|nr:hypothetical protein [Deltaproteobacteria bacterium]
MNDLRGLPGRVLLAALFLLTSCEGKKAPELPQAPASANDIALPPLAVPERPLVPPAGLGMSSLPPAAGFLLPETTTPGARTDTTESFVSTASLEDVIEFYRKRGYEVERHPAGAMVRSKDGEGLLQILAGKNRSVELLVLTQTQMPEGLQPPIGTVDPDNPDEATARAREKVREQLLEDERQGRMPNPELLRQVPQ